MEKHDPQPNTTDAAAQNRVPTPDEIRKILHDMGRRMDRMQKESAKEARAAKKRMRKAENLFTTQWGKLMESLVEGDLLKLLQHRDLDVKKTSCRIKGALNGQYAELDIVATGDTDVVVVEVKTTLRNRDVKDFVEKLGKLALYEKDWCGKNLYGAVAYLDTDNSVRVYAERQGLLVIRATGNSASIVNEKDNFRLREYHSGKFEDRL